MPWYPRAVKRPIEPGVNDPAIEPDLAVLHVDAGNASTLYGWFTSPKAKGVESHFHIRRDGAVEQYRDTAVQADAQVGGAKNAVSIETQGYGDGEWTPRQLASIKDLLLWLHEVHPIPLAPPDGPTGAGVGYHAMWSPDAPDTWARDGRTCPGKDRVNQYRTELVPWMSEQEDTMELTDAQLDAIADRVWSKQLAKPGNDKTQSAGSQLAAANVYSWRTWTQSGDTGELAGQLAQAVIAGLSNQQPNPDDVDALARAIVVELGRREGAS